MREEPMVADCNRESAGTKHQQKKPDLEPIDTEETKIGWHRGEGEKQGTNKKRASRPIDFVERNA